MNTKQREVFPNHRYAYELYPEYYLIKVNQFDDLAKDTLDEWIYFLKNEEMLPEPMSLPTDWEDQTVEQMEAWITTLKKRLVNF